MTDFEQAMENARYWAKDGVVETSLNDMAAAHAVVVAERDRNLLAAKYLCTMYLTVTGEPRKDLMAEAFTEADKALAEIKEADDDHATSTD